MVINDFKLLEQLSAENDFFVDYDELDLNNPDILKELSGIKKIRISLSKNDNNIDNTIKQLIALIEKCPSLEYVGVNSLNAESRKMNINELLNTAINQNIKQCTVHGFECDYMGLYSKIASSGGNTTVALDSIKDPVSGFAYIFGPVDLRKRFRVEHFSSVELDQLYDKLRFGVITLDNYDKYRNYLVNYDEVYISIGSVSELDLKKLESIKTDKRIKGIKVGSGYSKGNSNYYTIEDYAEIRKVVDSIVKMVKLPLMDDVDREKKIFAQIYKILGKNIRYDYYAISEEGKKDEELQDTCRNLRNGLIGVERNGKKQLLTVCAGYATILQNICACFDIKCDYISSHSKEIEEPGVFRLGGPRNYENGTNDPMGHGYNAVYLDGKAYFCDLTWDADRMKLDKLADNFLKSYEDFYKSHRDEGFSSDNIKVVTQDGVEQLSFDVSGFVHSYPLDKQAELFGVIAKGNIDEMISEGYLADFAMKNVEYIKQVKGQAGVLDYLRLIQLVHQLEDYIKSPKFRERASWAGQAMSSEVKDEKGNVIGQKDFIFYPGTRDLSAEEAVRQVTEMEERQWRIR